jgi:carbon storage regulator
MLVLSRQVGESIVIDSGGGIEVVVRHIYGNRVSLGIIADRDIKVDRREIWDAKLAAAEQEVEP